MGSDESREVVYILAESREGEIVQELLKDFKGVLVSDFYAAYDAIACPQQKCLIHLMRDLNDEILNNPFDEEMKSIAVGFAGLLKPMVETIDRRGLKKHFLRKHMVEVDRFYGFLDVSDFKSEAASKCKQRFEKNRDKLFTFCITRGAMEQQQCRTRHQGIREASGRNLWNVHKKGRRRIPHPLNRGRDLRISGA